LKSIVKVIVAQKGAREHFLAARALHRRGMLAQLMTDWYAFVRSAKSEAQSGERGARKQKIESRNIFQRFSVSVLQHFGGASARAARCSELPDELVHAFPLRSLLWKWQVRRLAAHGRLYEGYAKTDSAFASAVARCHLPPHDVFFGYSYASLEMLAAEKQRGVLTVLDQIDPGAVEFRLVAEEMARFPELAGAPVPFPMEYYERNRREWELADIIVVNSRWSFDALVKQGVPPEKLVVIPLCYESEVRSPWPVKSGFVTSPGSVSAFSPLRVLWLGQVNVRKGIHYLMEAARLLDQNPVAADVSRLKQEGSHPQIHFDIVGPIGISEAAVKSAPSNMTFHGPVSRDLAAEWYRQSDVFVLPTLSDGFALTQLEALAHGVPVIATPNCGRVVENNKIGFIVPARDAQALAEAILKFAEDRNLTASMAPACREAVKAYSVEKYGQRLLEIIQKHSASRR
jgi:glycosyltransferase involved in cell wall biosynthesis